MHTYSVLRVPSEDNSRDTSLQPVVQKAPFTVNCQREIVLFCSSHASALPSGYVICVLLKSMAKWAQHEVKLRPYQRGCHLITDQARAFAWLAVIWLASLLCLTYTHLYSQIHKQIGASLSAYKVGLANIFCKFWLATIAPSACFLTVKLSTLPVDCSATYISFLDNQ